MALAFDTCILVDILRDRRPEFRARIQGLVDGGATLHLGAVVFHELMLGAEVSTRPDHQRERVLALTALFQLEDWTPDDATGAAELRAALQRQGETIGLADSFIAGQALTRGWTLVTSNVREFSRVPGLTFEDWSA
uniref:PIN domain-containing protein n=1 Tax=uncultured Caulobacter sp. TaxID=158749 RepID=UPI0025F8C488|nr:PIN domain-containing protein [uncultured Caulobacter sp.]